MEKRTVHFDQSQGGVPPRVGHSAIIRPLDHTSELVTNTKARQDERGRQGQRRRVVRNRELNLHPNERRAMILDLLLLAVVSFVQTMAFTWVSRSRNSGDPSYHRYAARVPEIRHATILSLGARA
jgi:hypothetical protein